MGSTHALPAVVWTVILSMGPCKCVCVCACVRACVRVFIQGEPVLVQVNMYDTFPL